MPRSLSDGGIRSADDGALDRLAVGIEALLLRRM